ncbi:MAG: RluA family pseudouridine synthase, partial [Proteobacteria bacterium]|nr:RluA family pseudouridine synthase [Pseudomonadota bacterium]MBU1710645.1 RluA family pseudouridine synthase [Pseudomonadota bacterium]
MIGQMKIIYSDTHIVMVEKTGGLLAVPGRGPDKQDCVESRVKKLYPECIPQPAAHRLDMHTSGIMVLALTRKAHRHLSMQFENRLIKKRYIALVEGLVTQDSGEIQLPFRLDPDNRPYQVYDPVHGKIGVSRWRKIATEGSRTRIEFTPLTGRTHQLRLHASHEKGIGFPIVGDQLYGTGRDGDQLLLHASYLEFLHPETGET